MTRYVGYKMGKVHESHTVSDYYCGRCGYPVTDHDSYCPECGGAFRECDADCLEDEIGNLKAENEKLKNLVRDLHACNGSCLRCIELMGKCEYEEQLGELGIGVLDE